MSTNGRTRVPHWSERVLTMMVRGVVARETTEEARMDTATLLGNVVPGSQSAPEGLALPADSPCGRGQSQPHGRPSPLTPRDWGQMTPDSPAHSRNVNCLSICYAPGAGVEVIPRSPCLFGEDCPVGRPPSPNHPTHQGNIMTLRVWGRGCTWGSGPQERGFQLRAGGEQESEVCLGQWKQCVQRPCGGGGQV